MLRPLLALAAALFLGSGSSEAPASDAILIRSARVFDGTGAPAQTADVLVEGDRIVAVGPHLVKPRGAHTIDARGLTLLPGLHDLHTHLRSPAFAAPDDLAKAYAQYLLAGVTSVNDYSLSGEMIEPIRAMTASGQVVAPHLELAVRLGVPGGHGTEFGWGSYFTLEAATPRAAHAAIKAALAYRPDVIKVFADGWRYDRSPDLNSMNEPTLAAIVTDAHAVNTPVITHTVTLEGAKVAAAAGVDAVGHGVGDAGIDDELIALMRAHRTGYVATLVVYEPQQDRTFLPTEWRDLRAPERAREQARMDAPIAAIPALEEKRWQIMRDNIARLKAAGIPIGIGTDAGIGGVYHGTSTIREIRLLTQLGLTPAEALAAATSVSARLIGSTDHGRIAPGQRADLVLTGGRPDERIDDLYDVRRVFVSGLEVPLKRLRALVDSDRPSPLPVVRMTGPIDTGARGDGRTDLNTLPVDSTEAGVDHSHLDVVRPDEGAAKRLFVTARMGGGPRPYAQLVVPLTRGAILPADASGFTGIAFTARGTGEYRLILDSYGIDGGAAFAAPFTAGEQEVEVRLPFSAFTSPDGAVRLDPARLRALAFRLSGEPRGREWLQLAKLHFYR
ncbi:imidazolonepropionase-like amidohydrolase [Sphingomonas jinjuensis]|uniref:Imidazolonepropionase-like amidohydrolase n=1 Tax=Sphingomonas jinjuensis TaxID=535907 RepID=A0A840FDM0_9SPHN|nr:amidohydrolase family protein [Sphingomonas jinjuensis]MBB4153844.1 imidazolonepropionase-like amidohydrolase [Sphingomonas jinjuensis]